VSVGGRAVAAWTGCTSLGPLFADLPHYDRRVPCPPAAARTVRIDTTAFADGPQAVQVRAVDAAGNVQTAAASVVLDNAPPGAGAVAVTGTVRAGERLQALVSGFAGQDPTVVLTWQRCRQACRSLAAHGDSYVPGPGDVGHPLRVRVVATDRGGSTTAYSAETDPVAPPPAAPDHVPNGRHADAHARVSAWFAGAHGHRSTHVTARPGTRVRVRGTVRDPAGHPVSGAALDLAGLTARTHADGGFSALLRAASSRTLRVGYRPFSDSRRPIRSPPLRLTVRG
jgi:hypothetical protein